MWLVEEGSVLKWFPFHLVQLILAPPLFLFLSLSFFLSLGAFVFNKALAGFHHFYYCSRTTMRWEGNPINHEALCQMFGDQVHTGLLLIVCFCFVFFFGVVSTCVLFCLVLLLDRSMGSHPLILYLQRFFFHTCLATQDKAVYYSHESVCTQLTHPPL